MMLIQQTKNRSTINRSRRLLWGVAFLLLTSVQVFAQIKIEAENGSFPGLSFANSPGGFSGNGFVVGFTGGPEGKELTMTSNADPGMYSVFVRYTAGLAKGYEMHVNGIPSSGMFPATGNGFGTYNAGKALVSGGQVTIKIGKGWGSYGIDYVLLTPTEARPPVKPPKQLVDVNATTSTKALFSYLVDNYGSKVLSGQAGMGEIDYVMQKTGKEPAIGGFDFIDYSISRREHVNNEDPRDTEKNIAWTKKGEGRGILTMLWHWNAPTDLVNGPDGSGKEWYKGFYKDATTFDLAAALSNKNSLRYQLIIRDIDAVAVEMKKYRDNDIPLIFRPLHEGNGNSDNPNGEGSWFWWGAKGAGPFKELWHIMHDRLTNFHQLHNLIWVYTGSLTADWYPGDQYVDAVGLDMYSPHEYDIMSANWDNALIDISSKKLLSLSESGTLPSANSIRTYANWWSWFAMWGGSYLTDRPVNELKALYADVDVITRDELPDWRAWSIGARSTVAGVIPIPGVVEAENFDNGGEGLTFHDTTPTNLIGPYRSNTGVDTEPCSEGGNNLAFSDNGEWMEYSVHVAATGTYTLDARVSSPFTTGRFHIDMDGANVTGALAVPNTSGWQTWTTVSKTVTLTAGPHIMRFVIDTKEFNTNKFTFTALSIAQSPYDQVIGLPGVVEAENFDNGGESIAYHDTEEANLGAVQRTTGPDVFTTTENSNGVGWINNGEWLEYTVNAASAGSYNINARIASVFNTGVFHLEWDGNNISGNIAVPNTGDWQAWQSVTKAVTLTAGQHILRVFADAGNFNLNKITFSTGIVNPDPFPASGSVYRLVNRQSGKVLDVNECALTNGMKVQQWTWLGGNCQRWKFTATDNGYFKITAQHSGQALEIGSALTTNSAKANQWPSNDCHCQQWKIEPTDGGFYKLTARHSTQVLEVGNALMTDGAQVNQFPWNMAACQQWAIEPVPAFARQGVEEVTATASLKLSPNPASDQVNVTWEGLDSKALTLTVVNSLGQIVHQQGAKDMSSYQLNTSQFGNGLYIVSLHSGKSMAKTKLLVKH